MVSMSDFNLYEKKTRNELIDPELNKVGWTSKYIKEEVNPVKSDFDSHKYVIYDGKVEPNKDLFIDYLLLSEDYSPLAIVEAKRYSKDPETGRSQARTYAKTIEAKVGYKIPIFLTNGHEWKHIDEFGGERKVSGPFSQEDLKRRHQLYLNRKDLTRMKVNGRIVDRPKSIEIVKRLGEHFSLGHRDALIHMATGTGKTRVAMGVIDILTNANYARNVLFIADRITLANQAKERGFAQFFSEPVVDLRDGISKTGRFYATTVQTLMAGRKRKKYEDFSPAFFDLIIFDEAHRSLYDRNNLIFQYFDALHIGLTATPKQNDAKNTFKLFNCANGESTAEYTYDEAIRDGILVPYLGYTIETKVLSLGIRGAELSPELKDEMRRQELEPEQTEFSGSEFAHAFMDDKTNELVAEKFMQMCYKSDDGKPAKSIFFCASQKHAKHMKKVFDRLFPHLGNDVQVITSNVYRAEDEVRRFKNESEPRLALSVGMLDTGVDVPEVCNLVFVKPVFSTERFWQMVGRGTRNEATCKHREWLPSRSKNDFLILDFKIGGHSNIKFHEFNQSTESVSMDVMMRIFHNRVQLLNRHLDASQKKIIVDKILSDIESLNKSSFIVREKMPLIKKISASFDLEKYIKELEDEIAPLMITRTGTSPYVSSFILSAEKMFSLILESNFAGIEKIRATVLTPMIENVLRKDNLTEVKEKSALLKQALQDKFWDEMSFENVEFLVKEIAPLMKYFSPDPRRIYHIDAMDIVVEMDEFRKEIKEDERLKEVLSHPLVIKLKKGDGLTSSELMELAEVFQKIRPSMTIENVQNGGTDFMIFLNDVIGLSKTYDPRVLVERQFDDFIVKNSHYNSRQLEFLSLLKKVFSEQKKISIKDFGEPPLSNENPLDLFEEKELASIVDKCNRIKFK